MKPIISQNIRVRNNDNFTVGDDSVIDDYSYFSTKIKIGKYCHIASNCTIGGGKDYQFILGDFGSISAGVRIWCESSNFSEDLVVLHSKDIDLHDNPIKGDVIIGEMCGVGANSVIMPNNSIPDGVTIGSLSFVPENFKFEEWSVYAGIPIRFIKKRNRANVLKQAEIIRKKLREAT